MKTNVFVFYHGVDFDGHCSAAQIAIRYIRENVILIPLDHGPKFDINKYNIDFDHDIIYIVDFSFDPETMLYLKNRGTDVVWIDHHISAINLSIKHGYDTMFGIRDNTHAACELVHYYFHNSYCPNHGAIYYLGRYDVWDTSVKDIYKYQYGLKSKYDLSTFDYKFWSNLFAADYIDQTQTESIIRDGAIIETYIEQYNYSVCKTISYVINFEGLKCICASTSVTSSKFFDGIYNEAEHDAMIVYKYEPSIKKWKVSIYSTKSDLNVSEIAKKYGGGGHAGASGFILDDISILLNR